MPVAVIRVNGLAALSLALYAYIQDLAIPALVAAGAAALGFFVASSGFSRLRRSVVASPLLCVAWFILTGALLWGLDAIAQRPFLATGMAVTGVIPVVPVVLAAKLDAAPVGTPGPRRLWLAGGVAALAVMVSACHLVAHSVLVGDDSYKYLQWIDLETGSILTPQYVALLSGTRYLGLSAIVVVWIQIPFRALACAAVTYAAAGVSPLSGAIVGTLLALDPVSAVNGITLMSESLFTSGLVLSIAIVSGQAFRGRLIGPMEAMVSGLVLGLVFLIRPQGLLLIAVAMLSYSLFLRRLSHLALVGTGFLLALLAIGIVNLLRAGQFFIIKSGIYAAYPMLVLQIFSPSQGPASAEIQRRLDACSVELDYETVSIHNSNDVIWGGLIPCLNASFEGDPAATGALLREAYLESIASQPFRFASGVTLETLHFLATDVSQQAARGAALSEIVQGGGNCSHRLSSRYNRELADFVCPVSASRPPLQDALASASRAFRMIYQPYQAFGRFTWNPTLVGLGAVIAGAFAVLSVPGRFRVLTLGTMTVILYNAGIVAVAQHSTLRYVSIVSPLFLITTGLFASCVINHVKSRFGARSNEKEP